MARYHIHKNLSMRDALRMARELGCYVRSDGEWIIEHRLWFDRKRCKGSRKSAGPHFLKRLRRLAKTLGHQVTT